MRQSARAIRKSTVTLSNHRAGYRESSSDDAPVPARWLSACWPEIGGTAGMSSGSGVSSGRFGPISRRRNATTATTTAAAMSSGGVRTLRSFMSALCPPASAAGARIPPGPPAAGWNHVRLAPTGLSCMHSAARGRLLAPPGGPRAPSPEGRTTAPRRPGQTVPAEPVKARHHIQSGRAADHRRTDQPPPGSFSLRTYCADSDEHVTSRQSISARSRSS
jgi:hypothetical protein